MHSQCSGQRHVWNSLLALEKRRTGERSSIDPISNVAVRMDPLHESLKSICRVQAEPIIDQERLLNAAALIVSFAAMEEEMMRTAPLGTALPTENAQIPTRPFLAYVALGARRSVREAAGSTPRQKRVNQQNKDDDQHLLLDWSARHMWVSRSLGPRRMDRSHLGTSRSSSTSWPASWRW